MKENKINATIAITCLVAAVLMCAALSFAIGKWSLGHGRYTFTIQFPDATGIAANSAVKYAGALVGHVVSVDLIPRDEQKEDMLTHRFNCIAVVVQIDKDLQIGEDSSAQIKQDGIGISAKYVLITPGPDRNSKALASGSTLQGQTPFDLADLIQPAGNVLLKADSLLASMSPVMKRLDTLTEKMGSDLPPLIDNANSFMKNGNSMMANFNTPEGRARLTAMLDSLRVSSENLKVVSSNAKALTATLAQKPWRVFWGGPTVSAPPEEEVLKSNNVIPLKADVEINGTKTSSKKKN